jgi:hypothetical protein
VTRRPHIPEQLTHTPFSLEEARAAGLTVSALKGSAWVRLGDELYAWRGLPADRWLLLSALHRISPELTFSGRTAAFMHGLDFEPANPVEAIAPPGATSRTRSGIHVRRCVLTKVDLVDVRHLPATSLCRTLLDLCIAWTEVEALVAMDMAVRLGKVSSVGLVRYANERGGVVGCVRLRQLGGLAEPAESPMETRLRWLFIEAGLPRPQVQVDLYGPDGHFIGRADIYYPAARLAIEFDGGNHKNRLVADNRRQNELIAAGFTVLRFTTADLRDRPDAIVAQVRGVLAATTDSAPLTSARPFTGVTDVPVTAAGRNG